MDSDTYPLGTEFNSHERKKTCYFLLNGKGREGQFLSSVDSSIGSGNEWTVVLIL